MCPQPGLCPHDHCSAARCSSLLSTLAIAGHACLERGRLPVSTYLLRLRRCCHRHAWSCARNGTGVVALVALSSFFARRPGPGSCGGLPSAPTQTVTIEKSGASLAARSRQEVPFARISESKSSIAGRRWPRRRRQWRHAFPAGFWLVGGHCFLRISILCEAQALRTSPAQTQSQTSSTESPASAASPSPAGAQSSSEFSRVPQRLSPPQRNHHDGRERKLPHYVYQSRRTGAALGSQALLRHLRQAARYGSDPGFGSLGLPSRCLPTTRTCPPS